MVRLNAMQCLVLPWFQSSSDNIPGAVTSTAQHQKMLQQIEGSILLVSSVQLCIVYITTAVIIMLEMPAAAPQQRVWICFFAFWLTIRYAPPLPEPYRKEPPKTPVLKSFDIALYIRALTISIETSLRVGTDAAAPFVKRQNNVRDWVWQCLESKIEWTCCDAICTACCLFSDIALFLVWHVFPNAKVAALAFPRTKKWRRMKCHVEDAPPHHALFLRHSSGIVFMWRFAWNWRTPSLLSSQCTQDRSQQFCNCLWFWYVFAFIPNFLV